MKTLLAIAVFAISLSAQDLPSSKPVPVSDAKARELVKLRDSVDPALSKLQQTPLWAEYQKAVEDQRKANTAVDVALNKIKTTAEGKDYIKDADDYALALQEVLKGVDQTKWKLGPGYEWVAVAAPKAEPVKSDKEKK